MENRPLTPQKKDADYVFYELTRSICPQCRRSIDAQVILRDNKVYMRKRCPDCGPFEALVYGDAQIYTAQAKYNKPGTIPLEFGTDIREGCPLAERFGCEVTGIDYGGQNVAQANAEAAARGLGDRVRFITGDAEQLPCGDGTFDAIICECAFCTFPDKPTAAREFARVLKPGGRVGLSDLTRSAGALPPELDSLLAWVACIADAQPVERYADFLTSAGLNVSVVEPQDWALTEMVNQIRMKLLGAEIMVGLKKIDLPDVDFASAKAMASGALDAVKAGKLGYAIVAGSL